MIDQRHLVPLADSIAALRHELRRASARAASLPEQERFHINQVEIELSVVAEDATEGGGEVNWWIVKAGGKVAAKDVASHTVRFKLGVGDVEVSSSTKTE